MIFNFISCQNKNEIPDPNVKVVQYNHPSDQIALETAIGLAKALEDKDVRAFVKKMVLKEFDGDYNFLVGQAANKSINGTSFADIIYGDSKKEMASAILNEYPLLQIAMPELAHSNPIDWDIDSEVPLVAIRPINFKEGDYAVVAYDANGNSHYLSTKNDPNNLTIVVSSNERLTGISKLNLLARVAPCLEPYYADKNFNYYTKEQLALPPDDCGGDDPGDDDPIDDDPIDDGCNCDRDCKTTQEKLFKLKFVTISKLRSVEQWLSGKVELRIAMVYATTNNAAYFDTAYTGKRKEFRTCNIWANCNTIWKTLNRNFTEFVPEYGEKIKVVMYEEDGNAPFGYETTSSVWVNTKIDGEVYSYKVGVEVDQNFKDLGDVEIQYCDKANYPGKLYSNSYIEFYWGQN